MESEEAMLALGERLSSQLRPTLVVALTGPLGAGKTTFVRGALRGLGHRGEVRSPTFNLIHEYETNPPVCHVDLFRLESESQARSLGIEEYISTHAVFVEWAERMPGLQPDVVMKFEHAANARNVEIEGLHL